MERKVASSLTSRIRPVVGGGVALGLWLVYSAVPWHATSRAFSWGSVAMLALDGESSARSPRAFGDASVAAWVERTPEAAGAEQLRGETRFELPGSRRSLLVDETVEIDASGRLARAEINLTHGPGEPDSSVPPDEVSSETFDATGGTVSVSRHNGRRETRAVSSALPWIYLPVRLPSGALISTPVAASVARRAARVGNAALRLAPLEPEVSVTSDQFAVVGTDQEWVLLGDDLATFAVGEQGDLLKLNVAALGIELRPQVDLLPQRAATSPP